MPAEVYNANWFAGNLVRHYPLDSKASCVDDNGKYLDDTIITDISISYPLSIQGICYVSAVHVTENLVSIVLSIGTVAVAACCIQRPVSIGRYYTLDSLVDGVTGLISIGVEAHTSTGKWTFSDPTASAVLDKCCNPYADATLKSIGRKYDEDPLTGDILFTAGSDLNLTVEEITIYGVKQKAMFIGLDFSEDKETMLRKYLTECDIRTEMDTCSRKFVSAITTAIPNCMGNIELVSDDLTIQTLADGLIAISSPYKLSDMCARRDPFNNTEDGRGRDLCPFDKPESDDICPESVLVDQSISPLILRNPKLDLSLNYKNLYTSDIQIISGGAEYGDGLGFINVENEPLTFKTVADNATKVDLSFRRIEDQNYELTINYNNNVINVENDAVKYQNGPIGQIGGTSEAFHVALFDEKIQFSDEDYNLIFEHNLQNGLSNEIFVTINGIKCETIAYE